MSAHTPGPWKVLIRGERGTFHIVEAQRHEADSIGDGVDGYTVSKANANLISAAPDMLEALKSIENDVGIIPDAIWELRNGAIAKAEGRKR